MEIEDFGFFDEKDGCFVLKNDPPRKWRNYHYNSLGENEVVCEVSNLGDGQLFMRDRKGRTVSLSHWDAQYLYIRDDESGKVFNPWGCPVATEVTGRECRYYTEKTVLSSTCDALRVTQTVFAPRDFVVGEIWSVRVENLSPQPRKISLFAYSKFNLSGRDENNTFIPAENFAVVHPEIGGVLVTNRNTLVPSDRFKGYLVALRSFTAGCGYRDSFTRNDFGYAAPKILWGWNCGNESGYGPDCCGLVQVSLEIAGGATAREDFLHGQCSGIEEVKAIRAALTPEKVDEQMDIQKQARAERTAAFHVSTGHSHLDSLFNIFVKHQLSRYLIEGVGFRDNLQNDNAGALVCAKAHLENTLFQLSSQYPDGSFPLGFRPLRKEKFSDQPTYPMLTIPGLVDETGDLGILDREVPYFDSPEKGTVWNHLVRGMRYLAGDLGKNGLCNQRIADWNDGLEATREAGDRESVMVSQQFCYGLREMERLAKRIGDAAVRDEAAELYKTFAKRINEVAWDGRWFVRTICADGYRIGSRKNREGQIFINTQSWAILSGIAPADRALSCMDAVEELLRAPIGYRICAPAFTQYDPRVGKISNGMPGFIENAGCYCHAAAFKAVADCVAGRAENAWQTLLMLSPSNPANPISDSMLEPFSFTNSFSSVPYRHGVAGYPWRTGTAGWATVLLVEHILGARRHFDGLMLAPCLTKTVPHAKISRRFRGATYHISLDNTAGRCQGTTRITVDGNPISGNILPVFQTGEHQVEVII